MVLYTPSLADSVKYTQTGRWGSVKYTQTGRWDSVKYTQTGRWDSVKYTQTGRCVINAQTGSDGVTYT